MAIFLLMNKIKYKHGDKLYIYHWKSTFRGAAKMFQVNFIPSLVADRKTPFGALFNFIFPQFRVLLRRSTGCHPARTRPHPCSPCTTCNTCTYMYVMGNRWRNMAMKLRTDRSCETLWKIIIRGKSVLSLQKQQKFKKIYVTSWWVALNFIWIDLAEN